MREISIVLMLCASLVLCHPQGPNLENKQTLDDLINQIFTQDNSGASPNQSPNSGQNPSNEQIPTPVLVQGGGGVGNGGGGNGGIGGGNGGNGGSQYPPTSSYEQTPQIQPSVPPSNPHPHSSSNANVSLFPYFNFICLFSIEFR